MRTKEFTTSRSVRKGDIWNGYDRRPWRVLEILESFVDWHGRNPRFVTRFVAEVA